MSDTTPTQPASTEQPTEQPGELEQFRRELAKELLTDAPGVTFEGRLRHAAAIAVGAASACWDDAGAGVFRDDLARVVVDELAAIVHELLNEQRATDRERRDREREREQAFAGMVADLDRNAHGRHEGDVDAGDPTGISHGNPLLPTGALLGHSVHGSWEYRMPPVGRRHEPGAWKVRPQ